MWIVDLNSLEDRYYAGYGIGLSNYNEGLSTAGQQFYFEPSAVTELADLCTAIDSKIFIDSISADSLCAYHISYADFCQKVVESSIVSNELYLISNDYINAYGQ